MRPAILFGIIFFFVFAFFLEFKCYGQENDELLGKLEIAKEDTTKVNLLLQLYKANIWSDVKLAEQYANDALILSKKLNYEKGIAFSNYSLALIFVDYDFAFSEKLIIESLKYAEKTGDSLLVGKIENIIGQLKENQGKPQLALQHFNRALHSFLKINSDSLAAAVYNNIAISNKNSGNDSLAFENYFKAAEINIKTGNTVWLAHNYYNLGTDYLEIGDSVKGLDYLNKSLSLSNEDNQNRLFPYIMFSFGKHYYDTHNYRKAKKFALTALKESKEHLNRLLEKNSLSLLKDIYYQLSEIDSAYAYLEKIFAINDSIKNDERLGELDFLEMKYKLQEQSFQNELKVKALEAENERKELNYIIIILTIGIILLAFILLFFVQRYRIKRKSLEQKAIKLENKRLENELEFKKKELTTNVMYLMKKSEFIADIADRLQTVKNKPSGDQENFLKNIVRELERNKSKETWLEFEKRFHEVYSDFYKKLSERFPSLTPNDLKLCAFLKLNLSTKEIASLSTQSADSLKIARYRLRKKLGLTRDDNLVNFLNQI